MMRLSNRRDRLNLESLVYGLSPDEYERYQLLLHEAGSPMNVTDRLAIVDRAKSHVEHAALADKEGEKSAETHRRELWR